MLVEDYMLILYSRGDSATKIQKSELVEKVGACSREELEWLNKVRNSEEHFALYKTTGYSLGAYVTAYAHQFPSKKLPGWLTPNLRSAATVGALYGEFLRDAPLLNDEQKRVENLNTKYICVNAGPGTGKTTSIVARIRACCAAKERVLVMAYTNSACVTIADKLREYPEFYGHAIIAASNDLEGMKHLVYICTIDVLARFLVTTAGERRYTSDADYDQIVAAAREQVRQNPNIRNILYLNGTPRWRHIIVDEAQSVNDERGALVSHIHAKMSTAVLNDAGHVTMAILGDPKQKVARGAGGWFDNCLKRSECVESFKITHRPKTPEILALINYASSLQPQFHVQLESVHFAERTNDVRMRAFSVTETQLIAQEIQYLMQTGYTVGVISSDMYTMSHTSCAIDALSNALLELGVKFTKKTQHNYKPNGCFFVTYQSAAGMEFDYVYVYGLGSKSTELHLELQSCLGFVALTRSRVETICVFGDRVNLPGFNMSNFVCSSAVNSNIFDIPPNYRQLDIVRETAELIFVPQSTLFYRANGIKFETENMPTSLQLSAPMDPFVITCAVCDGLPLFALSQPNGQKSREHFEIAVPEYDHLYKVSTWYAKGCVTNGIFMPRGEKMGVLNYGELSARERYYAGLNKRAPESITSTFNYEEVFKKWILTLSCEILGEENCRIEKVIRPWPRELQGVTSCATALIQTTNGDEKCLFVITVTDNPYLAYFNTMTYSCLDSPIGVCVNPNTGSATVVHTLANKERFLYVTRKLVELTHYQRTLEFKAKLMRKSTLAEKGCFYVDTEYDSPRGGAVIYEVGVLNVTNPYNSISAYIIPLDKNAYTHIMETTGLTPEEFNKIAIKSQDLELLVNTACALDGHSNPTFKYYHVSDIDMKWYTRKVSHLSIMASISERLNGIYRSSNSSAKLDDVYETTISLTPSEKKHTAFFDACVLAMLDILI